MFVAIGGAPYSSNTIVDQKIVADEKFEVKTSEKQDLCDPSYQYLRPAVNRQPGYRREDS